MERKANSFGIPFHAEMQLFGSDLYAAAC